MSTRPIGPPFGGPIDLVVGRTLPAYDTAPIITNVSPNSDRLVGGIAVTITGRNFVASGGSVSVSIGGSAATNVVVVSSTQVTCNAPAHAAGVVDVSVTNGFGQTGTLEDAFVYVSPFITAITPNHGPLGGGTTVIIEGGNFASGSGVTFDGVAATSVNFIDENHYSCVTPAHAVGPVEVLVGTTAFDEPFYYTLLTRGEDIRRQPGISIQERIGSLPNTCSFTVDGQSSPPLAGEVIEILDEFDSDRQLFKGVVQTIDQIYEEQVTQLAWQVNCADFTFWLNRRRPFGQYTNVSVSSIILDLVAKYAPWVDTSFVQTSLCNVNVAFDGSQTFGDCLSILMRMLGGGHWYLDYQKRLHAFRVTGLKGSVTVTPENPQTTVNPKTAQPGVGTAMTIAVGNVFGNAFGHTPCWVAFYSTFGYDNGLESGLSKLSNIVQCDGTRAIALSSIPLGTVIGTVNPTKRRIYAQVYAPGSASTIHVLTIENNTLTSANVAAFGNSAGLLSILNPGVANLIAGTSVPANKPVSTPPKVGVTAPTLAISSTGLTALWNAAGFSGGLVGNNAYAQVKVTGVYQDGTESQASPASLTLQMDQNYGYDVTPPIFPDINGVPCLYVKVWFAVSPTEVSWNSPSNGFGNIIPNNLGQRTALFYAYSLGEGYAPPVVNGVGEVDPCDGDGPYLEDALDQPALVDENNNDLLREPALTTKIDISQIRNRIFVRGGGTVTTADAAVGATVLRVANVDALPPGGGDVIIGSAGLHARMLSPISTSGAASIALAFPLTQPMPSGSAVRGMAVVSDRESQRLMGRIELDDNGNPTDGIHEFFIDDSSLTTFVQQVNRAYAELELFSRPIITVIYGTRDSNSRPGRKVTFDLANPPVKGDFLIQSVGIDQIHDESDQLLPRYTVQASSVRFDLEDLLVMIAAGSKQMSSPGHGDYAGVSSTGIVETAAAYTDEVASQFTVQLQTPTVGIPGATQAGPVQGYGLSIDIPAERMRTLNSDPLIVIDSEPGKIIVPVMWSTEQNWTSPQFNTAANLFLVHDSSFLSGNQLLNLIAITNQINIYVYKYASGVGSGANDGLDHFTAGDPLYLKSSVDMTNGAGTMRVHIVYFLFDALVDS